MGEDDAPSFKNEDRRSATGDIEDDGEVRESEPSLFSTLASFPSLMEMSSLYRCTYCESCRVWCSNVSTVFGNDECFAAHEGTVHVLINTAILTIRVRLNRLLMIADTRVIIPADSTDYRCDGEDKAKRRGGDNCHTNNAKPTGGTKLLLNKNTLVRNSMRRKRKCAPRVH